MQIEEAQMLLDKHNPLHKAAERLSELDEADLRDMVREEVERTMSEARQRADGY
jgi:hypothetical protein